MGLFIAFAVLAAQAAPANSVESKGTPPSQVQTAQDPLSGQLGQALMLLRTGTRLTLSRGYREILQARLGKPI